MQATTHPDASAPTTNSMVAGAMRAARAAQASWAETSPAERTRILRRFHDILYRRRHEVAELITAESGKAYTDAFGVDVLVSLDSARWTAKAAPRFLRSRWQRVDGLMFLRKRVRLERRPLGVIGVISPWNYPFFLPAACVLPALACGNAVLLKPSEFTPRAGAMLGELLHGAGVPAGVLQVVQGDGMVGDAVVRSGVDKVIFTGSARVGRLIAAACAERMIGCSLELGGSDAAIVLADADLQHAADGIAWTRFANAGQTCVAPKRVFVEAGAYDAFIGALSASVTSIRVGDGRNPATEMGPMIHADAAALVRAQREDALARGARVIATAPVPGKPDVATGPSGPAPVEDGRGDAQVAPTVLVDVTDDMRVMREETFGPLLPVTRVADLDEAIARANATPFGLSASVWTRDRARALEAARRLEAGTVMFNDATSVVGMPSVPYGGVKASGMGMLHGVAGLEACVQTLPVVDDRFVGWRQPWWFRYGDRHLAHLEAFGQFAHAPSLMARLRGLPGIIGMLLHRNRNERKSP
ncbi:MAG TPA: aldehyde dehydrogenase family protein [Gemmatimonadaceae bacterium]|nr:aldehyde dehydrogenase family protein [Gemmatimonadaceae bacterium]